MYTCRSPRLDEDRQVREVVDTIVRFQPKTIFRIIEIDSVFTESKKHRENQCGNEKHHLISTARQCKGDRLASITFYLRDSFLVETVGERGRKKERKKERLFDKGEGDGEQKKICKEFGSKIVL